MLALFFAICLLSGMLIGQTAFATGGEKCTTGQSSVGAPSNLKQTNITDTTISLKWSAPRINRGIKSYNIYRNNVLVGSVKGTSFTDTGLAPNTDYIWTVRAVDKYNRLSGLSNKHAAATLLIIRGEVTWAQDTAPASINGGLIVEAGALLTIDPGIVVKIRPCKSATVYGTINAGGTAESPIIFTSTKDKAYGGCGVGSSGYWNTIQVAAGGMFTGDYVKITYGSTLATVQGMLILNNSEAAYAKTMGIFVDVGGEFDGTYDKLHDCCEATGCRGIVAKGQVNLYSSEIYDCPGTGVVVEPTGSFNGTSVNIRNCGRGVEIKGGVNLVLCSVSGCKYGLYFNTTAVSAVILNSFMGNNDYGVFNSRPDDVTIDASMNYWGSAAGPSVYDDATQTWVGDGDKVSKGVLFDNWLTEPAQ